MRRKNQFAAISVKLHLTFCAVRDQLVKKAAGKSMLKLFLNALDLLEEKGSVDEVFRRVHQIDNQGDRENTLKMLAKYFARQRNPEQAQRFTEAIRDEATRVHCLHEVARELRRKGYAEAGSVFLQSAYERVKTLVADPSYTALILFVISVELYDSGRATEALELLREAVRLGNSQRVLDSKLIWSCSGQLAKWGFSDEARTVAESIPDSRFRRDALGQLEKASR